MTLLSTDPIDLLLDDNDDLVIVDGDLAFSSGVQGVAQACRIAISMFQGEWFLNLDAGIPYWQSILGHKPALAIPAATLAFRDALQEVPGVQAVTVCDVNYNGKTRVAKVRWAVKTVFGDTPVDTITQRLAGNGSALSAGGISG